MLQSIVKKLKAKLNILVLDNSINQHNFANLAQSWNISKEEKVIMAWIRLLHLTNIYIPQTSIRADCNFNRFKAYFSFSIKVDILPLLHSKQLFAHNGKLSLALHFLSTHYINSYQS